MVERNVSFGSKHVKVVASLSQRLGNKIYWVRQRLYCGPYPDGKSEQCDGWVRALRLSSLQSAPQAETDDFQSCMFRGEKTLVVLYLILLDGHSAEKAGGQLRGSPGCPELPAVTSCYCSFC